MKEKGWVSSRWLLLSVFILVIGGRQGALGASTWTVTDPTDVAPPAPPPAGSLREILTLAGAGDKIIFAGSGWTIVLQDTISISNSHNSIEIDGDDDGDGTYVTFTAATFNFRLFSLTASTVTFTRLNFGTAQDLFNGAHIYADASQLGIFSCNLENGTTTMTDGGSVAVINGELSIQYSTFRNNRATSGQGGAVYFGSGGTFNIARSLFVSNGASGNGGAVRFVGGSVAITDTTFSQNTGNLGGAISSGGTVNVRRCTFVNNTATAVSPLAGALVLDAGVGASLDTLGTVWLTEACSCPSIGGDTSTATSSGYNYFSDTGLPFTLGASDTLGGSTANLQLGPLANNGGLSLTHALSATSPGRDGGDPSFSCIAPPCYDQRGPGFLRIDGATVDVGAFEYTPPSPSTTISPTRSMTPSFSASVSMSSSTSPSSTPSASMTRSSSVSSTLTPTSSISSTLSCSSSSSRSPTPSPSRSRSGTASVTVASRTPSAGQSLTLSGSSTIESSPSSEVTNVFPPGTLLPSSSPSSSRRPLRETKTPEANSNQAEKKEYEDDSGRVVKVDYCPDAGYPYGCNGRCVKRVSECSPDACDDPNECKNDGSDLQDDTKVVPVTVVIDGNDHGITIPVSGRKGNFLGSVKVPEGTFPKGTVIRVSSFKGEFPESEVEDPKGDCEDGKEKKTKLDRVSSVFDVEALSPKGTEKLHFKKKVTIGQVAVLPQGRDPSDVCLAFNGGSKDSRWVCEGEGIRWKRLPGKDRDGNAWLIRRKYDHFTGFAVLLGNTSTTECDGWGILQWLSVAFLITAGVVIVIVCNVYHFYMKHKAEEAMSEILSAARSSS